VPPRSSAAAPAWAHLCGLRLFAHNRPASDGPDAAAVVGGLPDAATALAALCIDGLATPGVGLAAKAAARLPALASLHVGGDGSTVWGPSDAAMMLWCGAVGRLAMQVEPSHPADVDAWVTAWAPVLPALTEMEVLRAVKHYEALPPPPPPGADDGDEEPPSPLAALAPTLTTLSLVGAGAAAHFLPPWASVRRPRLTRLVLGATERGVADAHLAVALGGAANVTGGGIGGGDDVSDIDGGVGAARCGRGGPCERGCGRRRWR